MFGFLAKLFKRLKRRPAPAETAQETKRHFDPALYSDGDFLLDDGDLTANVSFEDDSPLTAEQIDAVGRQSEKHSETK